MEKGNAFNQRAVGNDKAFGIGKKVTLRLSESEKLETLFVVMSFMLLAFGFVTLIQLATWEPEAQVIIQKEIEYVEVEVEKPVYIEVEVPVKTQEAESELNNIINPNNYIINVTDEDIELMARVVMSESSICDIDTKYAVASTIVNRVLSEDFPNTVFEVVHAINAYSTQDNGIPDADCYKAVEWALKYRVFPTNMFYFRIGNYHSFGKPLVEIDGVYFSTN